jgi:hypothetical protein
MFPRGRSKITKTFNLTQTEDKTSRKGGRGSRILKLQKKKLYDPVLYIGTNVDSVCSGDDEGNYHVQT